VEARLAACAQVSGPVRSTYWWKGELSSAEEWVCTFKTTGPLAGELARRLRQAHSYEVPEIVVGEIAAGDPDYLAWITEETAGEGPTG
jgi:periplasmic divalent cation tolerance protein